MQKRLIKLQLLCNILFCIECHTFSKEEKKLQFSVFVLSPLLIYEIKICY